MKEINKIFDEEKEVFSCSKHMKKDLYAMRKRIADRIMKLNIKEKKDGRK